MLKFYYIKSMLGVGLILVRKSKDNFAKYRVREIKKIF